MKITPRRESARRALLLLLALSMTATGVLTFVVARRALLDMTVTAPSGGRALDDPLPLPDFTLTDQRNEPVSLSDFRGEVTLLFFGYTHCPDICPTTLADFRNVRQGLGADAEQVNFVFVSVDGARDTPAALREYLRYFDEDFIGLTGHPDTVRSFGRAFNLDFTYLDTTDAFGNYLVEHTANSFLVDQEGRLRTVFEYSTPPAAIAADIRALLAEGGARANFLLAEPRPLADFTLTAHTGVALRLSDLAGRPTLLFFGYTHCPDICPTTLAEFKLVRDLLGDEADAVNFVFVSVDGARDTPQVVADYLAQFDSGFIGLTGAPDTVRALGADFNLFVEHQDAHDESGDYLVDHTASSFLIGADGTLRGVFPYSTLPEDIAATLRELLE